MPEFKERPKMDKPKPATSPLKQAARILKEKYRNQLDQHPEGNENEINETTDKMEGAGWRTVAEATTYRPRFAQRQKPIKRKEEAATPRTRSKAQGKRQQPKTRPDTQVKTKASQERAKPQQSPSNAPRKRTTATVKKATDYPKPSMTPGTAADLPHPSDGLTQPQEIGRRSFVSKRQSRPRGQLSTSDGGTVTPKRPKRSTALKERPRTVFKGKAGVLCKAPGPSPKARPAIRAVKATKQTAQQRMKQQAVAKAKRAAQVTADLGKKAVAAVVKAVAALVSAIVGLLGGGVLLLLLIFVAIVAAVASSPFGIFFSGGGRTGGSSVPTVAVCEAVSTINMEYNTKLSQLQSGNYNSVELVGQAADWPDVLAVFSSRYAADDEEGVDVATLDEDRVDKLSETFWDMTKITTRVETIHHSTGNGGGWTERILHITITPKTAEDMKTVYDFTDYQISALDELLADPAALASLAGSLEITNTEAKSALDALPEELSADRKRAVETALQLVGKVNYFWGGKSYVIGGDSRWGQVAKVAADGSPSTGTYRPYGLDCTGFIGWTFRNAGLPSDGNWYVGINLAEVTQADALPGDLALYPDDSHIGMVVGRNSDGELLICHCSSGDNNVVITEFAASGFTILGRPGIYSP